MRVRRHIIAIFAIIATAFDPAIAAPLKGWVDMHAHPMAHLAFGGKLIHGAPDVMALIPTDSSCRSGLRAMNFAHAMDVDRATHGGWDMFSNKCGDQIRHEVVKSIIRAMGAYQGPEGVMAGAPHFPTWPRWNDVMHQKMWIDWVKRAHRHGLRVMVALATHNDTLAASVMGPGDRPGDDKASADLQIQEIRTWAQRHGDIMQVAFTPEDLRRIVASGRLAIVLGVEIGSIGNFNRQPALTNAQIDLEIRRLHTLGVRYVLPIHVVDNKFGGTAVYENVFNLANYRESGKFWELDCARPEDRVNYRFARERVDLPFILVKTAKLGIPPTVQAPMPPVCGSNAGHVNTRGLTSAGEFALKAMMKRGMMIDIDHMSQRSANDALRIAKAVDPVAGRGYPLNSGHNEFRGAGGSENARTHEQLLDIALLGGMVGIRMDAITAQQFYYHFMEVAKRLGLKNVALGTDANGLARGPRPGSDYQVDPSVPPAVFGPRVWDYRRDGVAHYGLLPEFLRHVKQKAGADGVAFEQMLNASAEDFARMWERAETMKTRVR